MNKWFQIFDIRSLLLVLAAFVGNAQVEGFDLAFYMLSASLVLQINSSWRIPKVNVIPFLVLSLALVLMFLRSHYIGIPYSDLYVIWPLKALLMLFLISFGEPLRWPSGNMFLLVLFCGFLILIGRIEGGRLESVFGPNMLYRIFGILVIFSVVFAVRTRTVVRPLLLFLACLGVYASLLTGSSGALLTITLSLFVAVLAASRVLAILSFVVVSGLTVKIALDGFSPNATGNFPVFYSRLLYKMTTLEANERLLGWQDIVSRPISIFGRDYFDFQNLWGYGYEYPHNILVELIAFYGVIGLLVCVLICWASIKFLRMSITGHVVAMTFLVILLGSLLSGDLSDNYGVVGLLGAVFSRKMKCSPCSKLHNS